MCEVIYHDISVLRYYLAGIGGDEAHTVDAGGLDTAHAIDAVLKTYTVGRCLAQELSSLQIAVGSGLAAADSLTRQDRIAARLQVGLLPLHL